MCTVHRERRTGTQTVRMGAYSTDECSLDDIVVVSFLDNFVGAGLLGALCMRTAM